MRSMIRGPIPMLLAVSNRGTKCFLRATLVKRALTLRVTDVTLSR